MKVSFKKFLEMVDVDPYDFLNNCIPENQCWEGKANDIPTNLLKESCLLWCTECFDWDNNLLELTFSELLRIDETWRDIILRFADDGDLGFTEDELKIYLGYNHDSIK